MHDYSTFQKWQPVKIYWILIIGNNPKLWYSFKKRIIPLILILIKSKKIPFLLQIHLETKNLKYVNPNPHNPLSGSPLWTSMTISRTRGKTGTSSFFRKMMKISQEMVWKIYKIADEDMVWKKCDEF